MIYSFYNKNLLIYFKWFSFLPKLTIKFVFFSTTKQSSLDGEWMFFSTVFVPLLVNLLKILSFGLQLHYVFDFSTVVWKQVICSEFCFKTPLCSKITIKFHEKVSSEYWSTWLALSPSLMSEMLSIMFGIKWLYFRNSTRSWISRNYLKEEWTKSLCLILL